MASETMIQNAKAFLLQESPDSKMNLYDHMCSVMQRVLEERTPNAVDLLENLSKEAKTSKFVPSSDPSSVSFFTSTASIHHFSSLLAQLTLAINDINYIRRISVSSL